MMDLSGVLEAVASLEWDVASANSFADALSRAAGSTPDRDAEAGESWIRLLRDKEVVGYIHVVRPLVLAAPELVLCERPEIPVVVLSASLSTPSLSVRPDAFGLAFPGRRLSPALTAPFSSMISGLRRFDS
jgi:hypothetical protein